MRSWRSCQFAIVISKGIVVPESVLEAIRNGRWNFEPEDVGENQYDSTGALPGSAEKVKELADRAKEGLPLWHPSDRRSFDDTDDALK